MDRLPVNDNTQTRPIQALSKTVDALTHWQVPAGYAGVREDAFSSGRAVAMVRVSELYEALRPWLEPTPAPEGEGRVVAAACMKEVLGPVRLTPGATVRLTSDDLPPKVGRVREDGSVEWVQE